MPESPNLKLSLLIHDLKSPLAVIDLGARSLLERKGKFGPLTPPRERSLDHILRRLTRLRIDIDYALAAGKSGRLSGIGWLRGLLRRPFPGAQYPTSYSLADMTGVDALDAEKMLLLNIEQGLSEINKGLVVLDCRPADPDTFTPAQAKVFRRMRRSVKRSLILIESAKILAFLREPASRKQRAPLSEALRRPLVEIFDLYNGSIAERIDLLRTADELTTLAARGGLTLQVETRLLNTNCVLDLDKFSQVLVNLLLNAFRFRNKAVWLYVNRADDKLRFSVADDGEGMADEVRRKLMAGKPRVSAERSSCFEGHGIGLAGAQLLIKEMGGSLEIESLLGKGAKFSVTIPCEMSD